MTNNVVENLMEGLVEELWFLLKEEFISQWNPYAILVTILKLFEVRGLINAPISA